ncbi:MAG: hypothetical protein IPK32_05455 [Verrucomicrobiaceae bacterium]|nr:hypothetical protein [Verrucomicrobiaceae bacterium]
MVRNTLSNMEIVESLVEVSSRSTPKQVTVTVRMIEVSQTNLEELGFDWLMGGVGMNGNNVFAGGGSSGNGAALQPNNFAFKNTATIPPINVTQGADSFDVYPAQNVSSVLAGPTPLGVPQNSPSGGGGIITAGNRSGTNAISNDSISTLLQTGSSNVQSSVAPGVFSVAGVFTDPQFQTVLRALSQKKGVDSNSSPSVTTKSGNKASVEVVREFIYPTEFDPPQLPQGNASGGSMIATPTTPTAFEMRKTGVVMEVEPVISEDSRSVDLVLSPSLTEFEGFVNYGSPILSPASISYLPLSWFRVTNNPFPPPPLISQLLTVGFAPLSTPEQLITPNTILQPVFKSHKVTTSVTIWDGQTIVLGGVKIQRRNLVDDHVPIMGDLPFLGRLFRSEVFQSETKNVLLFVTVNVIDPSGH